MTITLQNIIPKPLKDRLQLSNSSVWNKELKFESSQFTKIVAPSGTGKTTLINMLYALRNDYEGNILYNNNDIKNINANKLANIRQQQLSIVFQDLKLFQQLTAFENIELKRTMQKPIYEQSKIYDMAEMLGITNILQQTIATCSYGEQQRVAIVRALIQPFQLLLLDEPFSHLDNNNTQKAAELIAKECATQQAGFVLTDLDEDNHFNYQQVLHL